MTTRADVTRLSQAQARIVRMAQDDLRKFFRGLDLSNPAVVRDALLDVVPALVNEYGSLSETAAAEWYETVRAREIGGTYNAVLGDQVAAEAVTETVRYKAGHLWSESPSLTLEGLQGSIQRYVQYGGRTAVARNAARDRRKPRFARVPTGAKTCSFCEMLASRGFVYRTEGSAGSDFHNDCDCQVVPEWDRDQHHIEGYDPDAMYERYLEAVNESGSDDPHDIVAAMRRLHPDHYTDGVIAA